MARPLRSRSLRRFYAAFLGIVVVSLFTASASAAPVELHNDRIDVDGGNITVADWLNPGGEVTDLGGDLDMRGDSLLTYYTSRCSPGEAIEDIADDGTITCKDIAGAVADVYVNQTGDTMTGALNMSGNAVWNLGSGFTNITNAGDVEVGGIIDMNSNRIKALQDPTSSQDAMTLSYANSEYLTRSGDSMTGDLDMDGNLLKNVDALGNGTTRSIAIDGSGNVEIPNGNLDMKANKVTNLQTVSAAKTSSVADITLQTYNSTIKNPALQDAVVVTGNTSTPDVKIPNGNLNMGSNQIKSVADPTSSQDAATYNWVNTNFLNRDGTDSMNGNLDLDGNDVVNVDEIGNSTQSVGFTSDVDMQGNSLTTSTGEVCIGDECA